ncbi:acyl CoA:acetate/3-ketoacid CoA transferase [Clostridium omnivorum]|uniref:Propionate CoA-transferase n=1 Tax=Clostridium omnivorum TaxID=1604902 RepID=A0ABQ5N5R5_9CLOT|nr:acyl CoA:acetate/3-ketoacid CoA transferase [Clostridium sp. E14]GLC30569.1 propionate CoA-transferase [Clostridium sp. E14]
MKKLISVNEACRLIKDGDTVGINGFAFGFGFPEEVCNALDKRFNEEQHPKNLTLVFGSGCGDSGKSSFGLDHFAHEGMVKRIIGGHVGLAAKLSSMINENKIEAYNFPQGVLTHLFRETAGGRPGVITHVGLETFADPRVEGAKMNTKATEALVSLVSIDEEEKLFYKSIPLQVALIRGTTADEFGNITIEKEGVLLETLHIAQAAKNSGGIVIAQVERIAASGTLKPLDVVIPGIMVDYVVLADKDNHKMNSGNMYDPSYTGEVKVPVDQIPPMSLNVRKVIAKRCAMELELDTTINLGIGVPEGVAAIALEEGISNRLTMTIEAGSIGGVPGSGCNLGAAANVEAIIGQPNIFDYYDGGGLDLAYLGLAQADKNGNINVSKFNGRMVGCGGFVNISQNTKKVIFCGTFTAGKSNIEVVNNTLNIIKDGDFLKFVDTVEQITFSGSYANKTGQEVLYITERAVFKLTAKGLELIEIAPGIDLEEHILSKMEFKPMISENLKLMDARIFSNDSLELASALQECQLGA